MFYAKNFVRKLSKSISSHFGAIHSENVYRSPKSQKNSPKSLFLGFEVIQGYRC